MSEKWIKASITGTIWAASEIVLGSFLHNLKIPFSGNILTAIGLIVLISISYLWNERGLFWRAGLICALMKTMSPSAVIFGPMIAIFSESLLLELSVRIAGRTLAGFMLGSMAAMSWNLFQQIINYIIFYGSDIIKVYTNLLRLAQKQLNIQTDIVWLPIIILLIGYALFGILAAVIGIMVGRKMQKEPAGEVNENIIKRGTNISGNRTGEFNYSILWLAADLVLMIAAFVLLNKADWKVWSLSIAVIIVIWAFRYKRALRQLSKPKFWIFFVLVTLITAWVFTKIQTGEDALQKGLLTGFQMNFRAAVIILGFSVLGTELYNPVIRNYFMRTSFRNLPLALELSAESLPAFIASIPDFKSLVKNPVSILHRVISQADSRLVQIRENKSSARSIFLITGNVGSGKTTFVKRLADLLGQNNMNAGGIISERIMSDLQTTGYDIVNIGTGERELFLRQGEECGPDKIGRFSICPGTVSKGNALLEKLAEQDNGVVIIDEVGALELQGRGWARSVDKLLENPGIDIIMTVRTLFTGQVTDRWHLADSVTINVEDADLSKSGARIIEQLRYKNPL